MTAGVCFVGLLLVVGVPLLLPFVELAATPEAWQAWAEAGRVSWPTRKETVQTTLIVFAFVVVMALFLFAVDSTLAWVIQLLTGRTE